MLLGAGADVNAEESGYGNTALTLAALRSNAQSMKLLLEKGAKPNWQNKHGDSPLIKVYSFFCF